MKNVVLVDFTSESIEALNYAVGFSKATSGKLEILNVSDGTYDVSILQQLEDLKSRFSDETFEVEVVELAGNVEPALQAYINDDKIGFVFSGTHELKLMEQFFSSRALHLLNEVKANFIFVPHNLKEYHKIGKVLLPILEEKKSVQNIEELRYLHQYMDFEVVLGTYKSSEEVVKQNLIVAAKLLSNAGIKYSELTLGNDEATLKNQLTDIAKLGKADLISIVNLTEENLFNKKEKTFVEDLIRNKEGLPILVIQNKNVSTFSGFHTSGGY
ncbi:hypothetical protein DNU06_06735 [Putridiphycobacter roseus]|uniref:UspA domain-containing protein n=1 Tax=Putridiphycobacter roseus TaxID=2219161 RepID=A0A2W1NS77_9FLAO|nr:universal stress protein [Putridiphycobacter roseus]PZE17518.1 hypothetical protein DNU06_06735 [Putridiphycobacter roseus]